MEEATDFLVKQGILLLLQRNLQCEWKDQLNCFSVVIILFVDLSAPKVRIKVETALAVEMIETVAYSDGLQPEQLVNLVKLATSGKYG